MIYLGVLLEMFGELLFNERITILGHNLSFA